MQDWRVPATVAAVYLSACALHNHRLSRSTPSSSTLLDISAVAHNVILVIFSAVVFVGSTYHFVEDLQIRGFYSFLCPPLPAGASTSELPPLGGTLHWWCYVFYLSKYYELVDTALLVARRKRVIPLHAIHHAFIPYVMCVLFDGRVSISLVSLAVVNSFVHVVMYAYYLASALGLSTPLLWKRMITQLQILQFTAGVVGGSSYWVVYLRAPQLQSRWPFVRYIEGCGGGEPVTVFVGYVMNCVLFCLFVRFYRRTYLRAAPSMQTKRE